MNKSFLTQMLGLCPLLAISTSLINALCLGIITTFVLSMTNFFISLTRFIILSEIRIPIYVMIISAIESCIEMIIQAYIPNLYQSIGIFIPLIVTNCIITGQSESIASKNKIFTSVFNGFVSGINITVIITIIGITRELITNGTIFNQADYILGSWSKFLMIKIINFDYPFLIMSLPPGAFIILGFLIAINNFVKNKN